MPADRLRLLRGAVALVGVALCAAGMLADAEASGHSAGGRIVFSSNRARDLYPEIYSVRVGGGGRSDLSRSSWSDVSPAVSPDGKRIAFVSTRDGFPAIHVMNANGGSQRRLTETTLPETVSDVSDPVWSPDGRLIAYVLAEFGPTGDRRHPAWKIEVVGAAGGRSVTVATGLDPAWSPDGRIAYATPYGGTAGPYGAVEVVRADGTGRRSVASGTRPAWSPDGRTIAFVRAGWVLAVAASGGTAPRRLARGDRPIWSPDGARIAFVRETPAGAASLYVMRADGAHAGRLASVGEGPTTAVAAWSPDGTRLASAACDAAGCQLYTADLQGRLRRITREAAGFVPYGLAWSRAGPVVYAGGRYPEGINDHELYTIDLDGTSLRQLTRNSVDDLQPSWSPSGRRIAFARTTGPLDIDTAEIHVVNEDGSGDAQLTAGFRDSWPVWSPDGSRIAFLRASSVGGDPDLEVMNADGSDVRVLAARTGSTSALSWAPDGSRIAFVRCAGSCRVVAIPADGGEEQTLAEGIGVADPDWSPDGKRLVLVAYAGGSECVCTVEADGTGPRRIVFQESPGVASYRRPAWSPDGTRVVFARYPRGQSAELEVADADGGGLVSLTRNAADDGDPAWGPS